MNNGFLKQEFNDIGKKTTIKQHYKTKRKINNILNTNTSEQHKKTTMKQHTKQLNNMFLNTTLKKH